MFEPKCILMETRLDLQKHSKLVKLFLARLYEVQGELL